MAGTQNPRETLKAMKEQWEIHYSRFFNFPCLPPTCVSLRPLPRSKKINPTGTWISSSSSSTASLQLIKDNNAREPVLAVSFRGKIYEEHYVSKLHFTWPQVSCLAECPVRGSRVVFASYRDCVGQVQKFAMRFSASEDSETFINSLKESSKDARNVGLPIKDYGSETPSPSEFISSNGIHYRGGEEFSKMNPAGNFEPLVQPQLNCEGLQYPYSEETILAHHSEGTYATLPPSFTMLLSDSCTEAEQEPSKVPEEVDFKVQMVSYTTDSSFHEMLQKIEMAIDELGGDMAL